METNVADQDEIFRLLVESVVDYAIFSLSPEGIVETWNAGAQRMTGYERAEIVGRHYSIFFPPSALSAGHPEVELHTALAEGRFEDEGWRVRKNGDRFWANVVVTRLVDSTGRLRGIAKVVRDLSERQDLRSALQHSEEKFKLLVEGTQDYAIFMLDPQGYIESWNRGVERIKGYTAQDVLGKHFSIFYMAQEKDTKPPWELEVAKKVGYYQEEGWRVRKDGSLFWASVLITALRDSTGQLRGFSKVTRDLTERRKADEALRQETARVLHRTGQLELANRSLEEFAYSVSHDLRAPLRALQGFSVALLEDCFDDLDDLGKEYALCINQGAQSMDKLIQDLLTYSRLGITDPTLEPLDAEALLHDIVAGCRAEIEQRGATVDFQGPFPTLKANRVILSQALTNLLNNALKFTKPGVTPKVLVKAESGPEFGRVLVCDNGIGVPEQYKNRIFKVFERLHGGETYPGTGIGLAIVARAAERMGGKFGLEDRAEGGSCFWIELPLWKSR